MKKLLLIAVVLFSFASCTDTATYENADSEINATDKDKVCPPGNPNC